jgi:hypothetical protein
MWFMKEKLILDSFKIIEKELKNESVFSLNEINYIQNEMIKFNAILEVIKTNIK